MHFLFIFLTLTNESDIYVFLAFQARYKQSLDPTVDEVKKLCTSLRRNAKEERVLFHYNGHGVPRPTVNGEIWVFNKVQDVICRIHLDKLLTSHLLTIITITKFPMVSLSEVL